MVENSGPSISRLGFGWDFFGIPNPDRGIVIGISYFGLKRRISKIPKCRGSGSKYERFEKISKNPFKKYKKNLFWPSGFFRDFLKIPGIFQNPQDSVFLGNPQDSRDFLSLRIFILRIRDYFILGILIPRFGIFRGFFIFGISREFSRDRDFFRGMGYPDKKPALFHK